MSELGQAALLAAAARAAAALPSDLRARGVVPTPLPVALHALRRVDALLRDELGLSRGLASEQVVVVDPAVGTGVWLAALLELTRGRRAHSRLIGIDDDARALASVQTLLRAEAAGQGAKLELRCANTLELPSVFPQGSHVRVIVGNPPWAARSRSRGGALSDAWLSDFRRDHLGAPLRERRSGVLSDDYVRFFRWALEHARSAEHGSIVCLTTNASYLDGPVHRGMRAALSAAFDRIEVLDLGGNALLSRVQGRDDNVFGVRVGSAISCLLRRPTAARRATHDSELHFARLVGSLGDKLSALAQPIVRERHAPTPPWFHFRPHVAVRASPGFSLADALPFHREGVQTNRDALATAATREELEQRLDAIESGALTLTPLRHFDPERARRALVFARETGRSCIAQLAYRPFDTRYVVTLSPLCHRPRPELLRAVEHGSLSLLSVRKDRGGAPFNLFACARVAADACFLSTRSSCRTRVFPSHTPSGQPNLSAPIADELARRVGREVSSAELIAYALAVLGSPRHRTRHEAALKLDYAHLPWPRDGAHFAEALEVGAAFDRALHEPVEELAPGLELGVREQPVTVAELQHDARSEIVSQRGQLLLRGVREQVWRAQVGQQSLVLCALGQRPSQARDLARAVSQAARWVEAEARADALAQLDDTLASG